MQKKVTLLLATLSIIIVFLAGCVGKNSVEINDKLNENNLTNQLIEEKDTQIKELKAKNEKLEDTLLTLKTDLNNRKEEADYYHQLIDDLINNYSDVQLIDLAKELWEYELQVNGTPVPADGIVEVQKSTIDISVIQRQPAYSILTNDIFMQGKISGNYYEHLLFNISPSETNGTDGTTVTGMHYKFVDVKKGETLSFSITEELKKRLGIDTSEITIKIDN